MSGRPPLREYVLDLAVRTWLKLQPLVKAYNMIVDPGHQTWDNLDTTSDRHLPLCIVGLGPQFDSRPFTSMDETCSICWSDIEERQVSMRHTLCNTVWHEACLQAYVDHVRSEMAICPVCRFSLVDDVEDVKLWKCTWRPGPTKRLTKRGYASCLFVMILYIFAMITFGFGRGTEMSSWQEAVVLRLRTIATRRARRLALLELHNELLRDVSTHGRLTQVVVTLGLFALLFALELSTDETAVTTSFEWKEIQNNVAEVFDLYTNLLSHGCWSVGWLNFPPNM